MSFNTLFLCQEEKLKQEEGMSIDVSCKDDCAEIKIITTVTEDLIMEDEVDTYANKTRSKFSKIVTRSSLALFG